MTNKFNYHNCGVGDTSLERLVEERSAQPGAVESSFERRSGDETNPLPAN
jgi:hypothetical protein